MAPSFAKELPEPQRLALAHAPRESRSPTLAVLALDTRLATFVSRAHEPLLAQVRLAWWRDRLAEDPADWPSGDPLLDTFRQWSAPSSLGPLVDGWESLLEETLGPAGMESFACGRAAAFAGLANHLGLSSEEAAGAGRTWALADLAANVADDEERAAVTEFAGSDMPKLPPQRALRPLAILGALGQRALARGGRPLLEGRGAALVAMRVGLFGR